MIATQVIASEDDKSDDFFVKLIAGVNQKMLEEMISPELAKVHLEAHAKSVTSSNDNQLLLALKNAASIIDKYLTDPVISQDRKSRMFLSDLKCAIDANSLPQNFSDKRSQEYYMAWLSLINPKLGKEQKHNITHYLYQKYTDKYASFEAFGQEQAIEELEENQTIVPHETYEGDFSSYRPEHAERCIDLLFANGNHFDVLETVEARK